MRADKFFNEIGDYLTLQEELVKVKAQGQPAVWAVKRLQTKIDLAGADLAPELMGVVLKVARLHEPQPTGKTEYVYHPDDVESKRKTEGWRVIGTAPTFVCSSHCSTTHFFKGDGCPTWKVFQEVLDMTRNDDGTRN